MNSKTKMYAKKVFEISRDALVIKYCFLSYALYALEANGIHDTELKDLKYATDGMRYIYDESKLIRDFASDKKDISQIYLHSVLHCLYLHPYFAEQYADHEIWDLSCDLFVWDIIDHLGPVNDPVIRDCLSDIKHTDIIISAQSLYSRLRLMRLDGKISSDEIDRLRRTLTIDDHILWYKPSQRRNSGDKERQLFQDGNNESSTSNYIAGNFTSMAKKWQNAADRATVELESAMKKSGRFQGKDPGDLIESLKGIRREDISYDEFLRKFASIEERMVVDIDSFDYNYYIYGLNMYDDMPLVEPIEYKEMHTIREFVIAIDTSGSIDTETLRKFLTKTYNILLDSIFAEDSLDVRIIQCDADIQNVETIHRRQEMDKYIKDLNVHGRGGTDFRPVFKRIKEYQEKGELKNLKGLIYFTDGYGTYPIQPTEYKSAFVFSEPYMGSDVPSWIIKYQLQEDLS